MEEYIKVVKFIAFDFDGVFTNNQVIVSENGLESVICNRSDGIGLSLLREIGIEMAIISTEPNPVVQVRAKKLKIDCYFGSEDKLKTLIGITSEKNIPISQVAFVGNDINDLPCLQAVGLPVAVADAYPEVKAVCKIILKTKGGEGAVREFCEMIYKVKKRD